MKHKIILLLLLLAPFFAWAQGEGNIWYFGEGAGIDFNSGSAVSISGPISTWEGCADICNPAGNVLFSTDGITVYNSTNAVMATGLLGDPSSTESGIIVPDPGNAQRYYIFSVAAQVGFVGTGLYAGVSYSYEDMTLSGGLGNLLTTNVPLLDSTAEKITAVRHANGHDVWVVTHKWNSDAFYAFLITAAGVSSTPVISHIGSYYYDAGSGMNAESIGYLKASPDGSHLAAAIDYIPNNNVELFNFNNGTGVVSNLINIPSGGNAYGVSFSPDNTKLYVSFEVPSPYNLVQYDLTQPNFQNNPYPLLQNGQSGNGALQIAPDGKIYFAQVSNSGYLSVINNPNAAGAACNFVLNGFPLNFGFASFGLPNFIDLLVANPPCHVYLPADTFFCHPFTLLLDADTGTGATFHWQDGSTNQTLNVTGPGTYYVTKTYPGGCFASDTIHIAESTPPVMHLGNDTTACHQLTLQPGGAFASYHWSTGSTASSINVTTSGTYWLKVADAVGCSTTDTMHVVVDDPQVHLGNDTTICKGSSLTLHAGAGFTNYQWSNAASTASISVNTTGLYSVTVTDAAGCTATDQLQLTVSDPHIDLGPDSTYCFSVNLMLNAGSGFSTFVWENNSGGQLHPVTVPGVYYVTGTNSFHCIAHDTIRIKTSSPSVSLGNDTLICLHTTLLLQPGNYAHSQWQDGSTASTYRAGQAGTYSITITDTAGCQAGASMHLSTMDCEAIYVPDAFTPNHDGSNDLFHILNPEDLRLNYLRVYNRWGELMFETTDVNAGWDGTFKGANCEVGVYVYVISGTSVFNNPVMLQGNVSLLR